ncbi:hypothetical protein [Nitrosomonas sp. Nm166]|uniref:hypothetical protein n=1 Tax=Nitrosomonas sp. Nm166 TaxID=1881054 RepID=UPI0008F27152|nr:hypothetical protein [Nitrosomonas sp. Nm166]SFF22845.1 hypothetical protein SAMN05428977_10768 [Nitrosomonas sp. Nm166]
MATSTSIDTRGQVKQDISTSPAQIASAVSWGAIVAGAAAIAVLSLILLILGTGLGLSLVSPWTHEGISATAFSVSAIGWLTFTQFFASGVGGYIAGRLRTKWTTAPADEVYFRDTAHGFLAWAVATLITAVMLTSVVGSIITGGIQAGATVAGGVTTTAAATAGIGIAPTMQSSRENAGANNNMMNYFIDSLFRRDLSTASNTAQETRNGGLGENALEVTRIFINSIQAESLPEEDIRYVGQLVAQHTDLTQQEAEKRVKNIFAQLQEKLQKGEAAAKEAADQARKASAYTSLWLFVSLLIGAFIASYTATYGGRQRDL